MPLILLLCLLGLVASAMHWTLVNVFRLCGVRNPEAEHKAMLWLLTIPATVGYCIWFVSEMARWGER